MTPGEKHRTPPVSEPLADTAALFRETAEGQLEQAWDDVGNWHEVTVIAGLWRFSDAG